MHPGAARGPVRPGLRTLKPEDSLSLSRGGVTSSAPAAPPERGRTVFTAAVTVAAIAVVVSLAAVLWQTARVNVGAPPLPPASLGFKVPRRSGNESAGWTYTLNVTADPSVQTPVPLVWGNVLVSLMYNDNLTWVYPYLPLGQATVQVTGARGIVVARENLSSGIWTDGYFVLVQTGQVLVVHGNLPPGTDYVHNGADTFRGPGLVIQFSNAGQPFTMLYPIQGNWVYT